MNRKGAEKVQSQTVQKLARRVQQTGSLLCVGLDYGPHNTDGEYRSIMEKAERLIAQTAASAAAFKLQLAGYLTLGSSGLDALRQIVTKAKAAHPDMPVILDAKFSDIAVSLENYARFAFDWLGVDAVTANPYLGRDACRPLLDRTDRLIYWLCSTSNPGSADFQGFGGATPLYLEVARRVAEWNAAGNCGLVVGATHPERIAAIREAAPDLPFLMPGLGAQGGDPAAFLPPALNGQPGGVIVNVSRGIMETGNPAEAARQYRDQLQAAAQVGPRPVKSDKQRIAGLLEQAGCVQHGEFTLASGQPSSIYIDLRLLSGQPDILAQIAEALDRATRDLAYEAIVTIPTAGLPLGTALALRTGKPLLYVRKEAKDYGRQQQIEGGTLRAGQRMILLDDVISTGGSKVGAIEVLREMGVEIAAVVVVVDRREKAGGEFTGERVVSLVGLADLRA